MTKQELKEKQEELRKQLEELKAMEAEVNKEESEKFMIKQTVIWTIDDRVLCKTDTLYPECLFVKEDCQDMLIIAGHCVCNVHKGKFSSCPYLREE